MPSRRIALAIVACAATHPAAAKVTITATGREWDSSTYKYWGPQKPEVQGPALFLEQDGACCSFYETCDKSGWKAQVQGKVVVLGPKGCSLYDLYPLFAKAGAVGLVTLMTASIPGAWSHEHKSQNPPFDPGTSSSSCLFCNYELPLVEISDRDIEIKDALANVGSGTVIQISIPHVDIFERSYESFPHVLFFRVLFPLFALLTAYNAAVEILPLITDRETWKKKKWAVRQVICMIECPCLLIVAMMLSLGQFAATVLDYRLHYATTGLLSGVGVFTTVILALVMREIEQKRANSSDIITRYRHLLTVTFLVTILVDAITYVTSLTPLWEYGYTFAIIFFLGFFTPLQIAVSVFFISRVSHYRLLPFIFCSRHCSFTFFNLHCVSPAGIQV